MQLSGLISRCITPVVDFVYSLVVSSIVDKYIMSKNEGSHTKHIFDYNVNQMFITHLYHVSKQPPKLVVATLIVPMIPIMLHLTSQHHQD